MAVTKDLGAVTAYAHAVEGGYTGTLSDFETLMASYATVAQQAAASASDAEAFGAGTRGGTPVSSGDNAYENNAPYYAGVAETAAAATSSSTAEVYSSSATYDVGEYVVYSDQLYRCITAITTAEAWTAAHWEAVVLADELEVANTALETKAEIDGYYDSMTVSNAEQLVSTVFVNDEEPYNFRTSGGSIDIGDRETDMLVGGTVAWNQLVSSYTNIQITTTEENGIITITQEGVGSRYQARTNGGATPVTKDHVYLEVVEIKSDGTLEVGFQNYLNLDCVKKTTSAAWTLLADIKKATATGTTSLQLYGVGGTGSYQIKKDSFMLFDLSQMFGSTIADYIYSLEQANAGAGVAWFRKLFPKPYYAYNAGELMSVNTSAHNTVGFNLLVTQPTVNSSSVVFDVTKATRVFANTHYHLKYTGVGNGRIVCWSWDLNGNRILEKNVVANGWYYNASGYDLYSNDANQEDELTFAKDAYVMFFYSASFTSVTDMCLNLSWDGERDGEYEAYVKHSYALDSDLVLRGIPKLDNGNLYYDGDTYASDGAVTRKYGIVDLGTLNWRLLSGNTFWAIPTGRKTLFWNGICPKYFQSTNGVANLEDKAWTCNAGSFEMYIRDTAYTDATAFKASLDGVMLVYELATPTTETADPFQSPQIVDDFGTEEYVDYAMSEGDRDVAIPVGHITKYMNNLRAKLEMAPNSPDGAGDYLVRQTNGINEYVSLASNATIQDIISRLEALEGQGGE